MDTKRDMEERLVASILAAYHTTRLAEVGPITHIMAQGPVLQCFKNLDEYATLPLVDDNKFQKLARNESFERVAKVAEERAAFNEQMREKETNMMTPVTQDDRNAAAALYLKNMGEPLSLHDKSTAAEIEMGVRDDWDCVQAFAAHRIAAEAKAIEAAASIAEHAWIVCAIDVIMDADAAQALCERTAETIRAALEARGLEIREKGK